MTPEQGIQVASNILAKHPKNAQAYARRAEYHLRLSHGIQAESHLRQAADDLAIASALDMQEARLHSRYAEVAAKLQEYQLAVAEYSAAIKLSPQSAEHYVGRGLAYLSLRQDRRSQADLKRALKWKPSLREAVEVREREIRDTRRLHDVSIRLTHALEPSFGATQEGRPATTPCLPSSRVHPERCEGPQTIGPFP